MNNCIDHPCKYRKDTLHPKLDGYCVIKADEVPDRIDEIDCEFFKIAKTCLSCKHSEPTIYETGTIDDIEYRCPFQNNKLVYDDLNPYVDHYSDIPKCNVERFEEIE